MGCQTRGWLPVLATGLWLLTIMMGCGGTSPRAASSGPPGGGTPAGGTAPGAPSGGPAAPGGTAGAPAAPGGSGGGTASTAPTITAYIYVGSSASGQSDEVFGFTLNSAGSVSSTPGSPYPGPSNSLVTNSPFVFGLSNAPANPLATFARAPDGSLHLKATVNGNRGDLNSSAAEDLSLDHSGQSLYVAVINAGGTENNDYDEYTMGSDGSLRLLGSTAINVDAGGRLAFSPDNHFAYATGCHFANWDVVGYRRSGDGSLTYFDPNASPPPNSSIGTCPVNNAVSSQGSYVVSASGNPSGPMLVTYSIKADGSLSRLVANPVPVAPSMLMFDPSGTLLAAATLNSIQTYRLGADGSLTPVGGSVSTAGNVRELQWDAAGHLFAIDSGALYVFSSQNGGLSPLGSPFVVSHGVPSWSPMPPA